MAKKTFKGRPVLPGDITGTATVSRQAFNTSGSYMENMFAGRTDAAPCSDASNKELFGKDISGAILCTSTTVGSTMGGMYLIGMKAIGVGPEALAACA
jgi:predicted aconitase with swiveling domain